MDAFISWTSADRDIKNALMEKLGAAGIDCWDSDEECTSDYSSECISNIHKSGLFIVIVSDASMEKGYVINEVIEARKLEGEGKLNILVYKITDAPYTAQFSFQLNHISMVSGNMVQRKEIRGGESGLDLIVRRAVKLLTARKEGNPEKPMDVHTPKVGGLAVTATGYFVENSRDELLETIARGFEKSNVLVMREFSGFGKRTVIRKFVENNKDTVKNAVFVHNTQGKLRSFLLTDLHFTNLNTACFGDLEGDALISAKLHQLEKLDESNLLIISDVDCSEMPDPSLCQQLLALKCRIILLTQDATDSYDDWFPVIRVGRMEDSYLTQLFFHHYNRADADDRAMLEAPLERFFDRIGGHTKTVELTASMLRRDMGAMPEEVADYLSLECGEGVQLQDRIMEQISQVFNMTRLDREQEIVLLVAACLAVPDISERSFRQVLRQCGVSGGRALAELEQRGWIDLDLQNQTVSMEPLVSQIVYRKYSTDNEVLTHCRDFVQSNTFFDQNVLSTPVYMRTLRRYAYFCGLVGAPLLTQALLGFIRRITEESQFQYEELASILAQIEATYPAAQYNDLFWEEEENAPFFTGVICFFRESFLPILKFFSNAGSNLVFNYAHGEQLSIQMPALSLNMEELTGMSAEEVGGYISYIRTQLENAQDLGQDDWEILFMMECINLADVVYNRKAAEFQVSITRMLDCLYSCPEILESEANKQMFNGIFLTLCNAYIQSEAYGAAAKLCQQVMEAYQDYKIPPKIREMYIATMRRSGSYTEELFSNYEALLDCYETEGDTYFDRRNDLRQQKLVTLLAYADDLTQTGDMEMAIAQFVRARNLGGEDGLEMFMSTANKIVSALVSEGDFDGACDFVKQYITPQQLKAAVASADEDTRATGEMLESLFYFEPDDRVAEDTPGEYLSYYHDYPRKNNSVLDRKYFAVAELTKKFDFSGLTDEQLAEHTQTLREKARRMKILELAPEAFALVSEAGYRVLGYRHHYVQYIAGAVMADGKIAEVLNGEGKTYAIVLTAFLHSLYQGRVFVVDETVYLTQRNYNWMRGVYDLLGVSTYLAVDDYQLRGKAFHVCYITLKQMVFSYLDAELYAQHRRDLDMSCVIIDEADMVLVDQAKQPFSFVQYGNDHMILPMLAQVWELLPDIKDYEGYYYTYQKGYITLLPEMNPLLEQKFKMDWSSLTNLEQIRKIEHLLICAIRSVFYYEEGKDYFVHKGSPVYENKMLGNFESFGAEEDFFLRKKHDLLTKQVLENLRRATLVQDDISIRDLFRKCGCLCGTTATAASFQKEFKEIYGLDYVAVPPHKPCIRKEQPVLLYVDTGRKIVDITALVAEKNSVGQPVLLCTQSVEESEIYSEALTYGGVPHKLLNAKNASDMAGILACAGMPGSVLVANALAGRGADIKLGGDPERMTRRELVELGVDVSRLDRLLYTRPTEEICQLPLYKRYHSILEKNRLLCAQNRQEVLSTGGLCVITTSLFAESRNEQQAIGRAGRQGDPGESYVFRCLDDEAFASLLPPAKIAFLQRVCADSDLPETATLRKSIRSGQKALHEKHFANVRKFNTASAYVDEGRPQLIEQRMALVEGKLTFEQMLRQWASDKEILRQLQELQKGADNCASGALMELWKRSDTLRRVRGMRTPRVLCEELLQLLSQMEEKRESLVLGMEQVIRSSWQEYIKKTQDWTKYTELNAAILQKQLSEERTRLQRGNADMLIRVLLKLTSPGGRYPTLSLHTES